MCPWYAWVCELWRLWNPVNVMFTGENDANPDGVDADDEDSDCCCCCCCWVPATPCCFCSDEAECGGDDPADEGVVYCWDGTESLCLNGLNAMRDEERGSVYLKPLIPENAGIWLGFELVLFGFMPMFGLELGFVLSFMGLGCWIWVVLKDPNVPSDVLSAVSYPDSTRLTGDCECDGTGDEDDEDECCCC